MKILRTLRVRILEPVDQWLPFPLRERLDKSQCLEKR